MSLEKYLAIMYEDRIGLEKKVIKWTAGQVQGAHKIWVVGQAILINRLLYASPVWWGFTDASDKQRLQAVITRAQRLGFLSPSTPPLSELCGQADDTLFSAIVCNRHHVLHGLLPPIKSTGHDLRTKSHDRALLPDDPLSRQNFINRMLTNNYYYAKL